MIFAEGSLKEADTGFEGKGHIPVNDGAVGIGEFAAVPGAQVFACKIKILQHFLHNEFPAVPRLIEIRIVVFQRPVIPGDISESLYFIEIEYRPHQTRQGAVMSPGLCRNIRIIVMGEEIINIAQASPTPVSTVLRRITAEEKFPDGDGRHIVADPVTIENGICGRQHRIETVGIELKVRLRLEGIALEEFIHRILLQRIASERQQGGKKIDGLFHRIRILRLYPMNSFGASDRRCRRPSRSRLPYRIRR